MAIRKKLLAAKNSSQPAVLVRYAKRHQVFVKKLVKRQLIQTTVHDARFRRHGDFLFYSMGAGRMTPNHIESVRRILLRYMQRLLRIWMCIRFTGMVTAKPREIRMGKGKGAFAFWSRTVEVGSPLFEISFVKFYPAEYLFHFFRRFRAKFTVPVRLVERCPKRFFLG